MKVLIADDSLVMRRLLEATLTGWGYDIVSASDGAEAWECLQREDSPPLAILDWIMPVHTGPELCRLVRAQQKERYTYILLLTSKSQREDIVEGMGSGADDYVTKPFDQHELEVRVRAGRRILDLQDQLMRTKEALREQATHDSLTGCWNRATVMDILSRELTRSRREQSWLGVMMMDLDHFKSINDTFGHAAGDLALKEVVVRMEHSMRAYDALGRYGGEEFLVILPGCDENAMLSQSERLRQAITASSIDVGSVRLSVSASFGATSCPPGNELTIEQVLHAADDALYRAKRLGRNRVIYAPAQAAAESQSRRV